MLPLAAVGSISTVSPTAFAGASALGQTAGHGFAQVLGEVVAGAVDTLGKAEATSISALQGKASLHQVVDAVTQAEQTLQTTLAIRDKAVGAWSEISRMAI